MYWASTTYVRYALTSMLYFVKQPWRYLEICMNNLLKKFKRIDMQDFLINDKFLVHATTNEIQDNTKGVSTRVEPRVMQVLLILAANSKKLVTRETLAKEVWDDYGGADEGLTQAVSFLRKVLEDGTKTMIRTVPKKGYVLEASITDPATQNISTEPKVGFLEKRSPRYFYPALGLVVAIIAAVIFGFYYHPNQPTKPPSLETAFPGTQGDDDLNAFNAITTTDSLGNKYRLVMKGDRRPEFYVNDSLLTDQEPYTKLIDRLSRRLWKRQAELHE